MKRNLLALLLSGVFVTGAVAQNNATNNTTSTAANAGTSAATNTGATNSASTAVLEDMHIAEVVHVINQGEIDAGEIAVKKSEDQAVKSFAQQMIDEHERMDAENKALAKKMNISLKESQLSQTLRLDAKTKAKELKDLKGSAFDKAYIDSQVKMHQTALSTVQGTLLPNAKNAELKAMLQKAAPAIEQHLNHAKNLQNSSK